MGVVHRSGERLLGGSSSLLRDPPHPLGPGGVRAENRTQRTWGCLCEGLILWFQSFEKVQPYETVSPLNCLQLFSVRKGEFFDL